MTSEKAGTVPDTDELVEALRGAGWLLEQESATALREAGFEVMPGYAFKDPDDPRVSREVDVAGFKELFADEGRGLFVFALVFIERKQSQMPYALIGRPTDERARNYPLTEHSFPADQVTIRREQLPGGSTRLHGVATHRYLGLDTLSSNP